MVVSECPLRFPRADRAVFRIMILMLGSFIVSGVHAQTLSANPIKVGRLGYGSRALAVHSDVLLSYGVYPKDKTLVDGYVEYNTSTCDEISAGSWAVTQAPQYGVTATGTVSATLGNGDCPGVTFTFAVLYYTWTSKTAGVTADTAAATWTSPDFSESDTFAFNLVHLQINLVSPPPGNAYPITATPAMPTLQATGQVVNASPDPTSTTAFTWTEKLTLKNGTGQKFDYSTYLQQSATTTGTAPYTLTTTDPTTVVGGKLTLTITATVNGYNLTSSTPIGLTPATALTIIGTNPQRSAIQSQIATDVPTLSLHGLAVSHVTDVGERIACDESQQREFKANADGGTGPVLISGDNGAGIFQLTSPSPFNNPNLLFNWQQNTMQGLSIFSSKIPGAKGYPGQLRGASLYTAAITNTVNPIRIKAGLAAITTTPAPTFTSAGAIGSTPPNQLLEDTTRGFNGYGGPALYGYVLHEFEPSLSYLETVPNAQLSGLGTNSLVWMRVPVGARGTSGTPNYVALVTGQSPQCGD